MKIKQITDRDLDFAYDVLIFTTLAMFAMAVIARIFGYVC